MSIYLIHAFDEIYGGMHGVEMWSLEECKNESDVKDIAIEMSKDIIDSYGDITDELRQRAEDYVSYDIEEGLIGFSEFEREQRLEVYYEECVNEDVAYTIVKLDSRYTLEEYSEILDSHEYWYDEIEEIFGVEEV